MTSTTTTLPIEAQRHADAVEYAWQAIVAARHETSQRILQLEVALHGLLEEAGTLQAANIREALQRLRICTADSGPYDLIDRASTCLSVYANNLEDALARE